MCNIGHEIALDVCNLTSWACQDYWIGHIIGQVGLANIGHYAKVLI
jgi:hypothetical protein